VTIVIRLNTVIDKSDISNEYSNNTRRRRPRRQREVEEGVAYVLHTRPDPERS